MTAAPTAYRFKCKCCLNKVFQATKPRILNPLTWWQRAQNFLNGWEHEDDYICENCYFKELVIPQT